MAAALATLALAAASTAARAGIHVDPGGPAGKQYSALDDRARQDASGEEGSAGVPGSSEQAPLFGEGSGDGDGGGGAGGAPGSGGSDESSASGSSGSSASGDGDGQALVIGGAAVAVLAAGGLLAALLIRRRPDPAS